VCDIFACISDKDISQKVIDGLKLLEYRGYDSCGIAVIVNGEIYLERRLGALAKSVTVE
jgi:glucosamine--fructose-6-phosphate aminotransferase (isomerizing)